MQKSSFNPYFPSIIHSISLKICNICKICKFLKIHGFGVFPVLCILFVFFQKKYIFIMKRCIFIKSTQFNKNSSFPIFCELCPTNFPIFCESTPETTTYLDPLSSERPIGPPENMKLDRAREIYAKIQFLPLFFFNYS